MNAVSLNTLQFQSSMMLGPAVAGFLIAGLGVGTVVITALIIWKNKSLRNYQGKELTE